MRTYLFCLCFIVIASQAGEPLSIAMPFAPNLPGWWRNSRLFNVPETDSEPFLVITGNQGQELGYQRMIGQVTAITAEQLSGQQWQLSFQALIRQLHGAIKVEVRQIDAAGKSVCYNTIRLCQYDQDEDWQQFSLDCQMAAKTSKINIHITADFLKPDDVAHLKRLTLLKIDQE